MADIELVIKIPKELYDDIKEHGLCGHCSDREIVSGAIANGTPLDKHDEEVIAETVESIWGKPPYMDMLDKIRDEIEQLPLYCAKFKCDDFAYHIDKEQVLDIIDKYRGEEDEVSD